MVNHCYNAKCNKELLYLRDGRVVRIMHDDGENIRVEHFWLCGPCSQKYEFVFGAGGSVSLRGKGKPRFTTAA